MTTHIDQTDYGRIRMLDTEIFPNYFIICLDNPRAAFLTVESFLAHLNSSDEPQTLVTYNGLAFDLPLMRFARAAQAGIGDTARYFEACAKIKGYATQLIEGDMRFEDRLQLPPHVQHIDLLGVCPPFTSLKLLSARLGCESIQDLPFHHSKHLTAEERKIVGEYCMHDLMTTRAVFEDRKDALDVRTWQQKSLSDAQIAERTLVPVRPQTKRSIPRDVTVFGQTFAINPSSGAPVDNKDPDVVICGVTYQVGMGGLHSVDTPKVLDLRKRDDWIMVSSDVASYYPSMLLGPLRGVLDDEQERIYRETRERRLDAKRTGDKQLDATLKIVLNGSFGKLGSKYSPLYNPMAMLSVTLLGQKLLLELIQSFADHPHLFIKVLSANTDGIEVLMPAKARPAFLELCNAWEQRTTMVLEHEDVRLAIRRDVNNYAMLTRSKKKPVKTKGIFEPASIKKSPAFEIIYETVLASFGLGREGEMAAESPRDYILRAANDPAQWNKFLSVRTVNGGAITNAKFEMRDDWTQVEEKLWTTPSGKKAPRKSRPAPYEVFVGGDSIGRVIRWYIGEGGANVYTPQGGKVPLTDGAVLVQNLLDFDQCVAHNPIDVDWYITRAEELRAQLLNQEKK